MAPSITDTTTMDDENDIGAQQEIPAHTDREAASAAELNLNIENVKWWQNPAQVTAMVSNFSTSYNVVNISLALPILQDLYEGTAEDSAACASSLLAGMMLGQVLGGALGDSRIGRLGALKLVMVLQIVTSLGSATLWGDNPYVGLAIWRFFLGIGAGAVYPLAATLSAEQTEQQSSDEVDLAPAQKIQQLKSIVLTFAMQGVGFLAVPLVAMTLLYALPDSKLDVIWRVLLALGSVPGLILALLQRRLYTRSDLEAVPLSEIDTEGADESIQEDSIHDRQEPLILHDANEEDEAPTITEPDSIFSAILLEPNLCQKLLGTAGTWFLFDVLFYGNTLFQPIVMEAAFGNKKRSEENVLRNAATDSLLLALIALPGYIVSALVMGKRLINILQTPRYVQMQGFVAMSLLYSIIGSYWSYLRRVPALLIVLYGFTFFFANYGPNTTTFIFPSLVFSRKCRSTLNGISAAAGKAGALVGATLFAPAASAFGDDKVMLICATISVAAFALTTFFTRAPDHGHVHLR